MTNEELAAKIQAGERDRLPELWEQVERFVASQAQRLMTLYANGYMTNTGGLEFEDLYNSGYIALVAAVDTYDTESGKSFIGWFAYALQNVFAETGGWRSSGQKSDALRRAVSLDAPPNEDGGEDVRALAEFVEDPSAAQSLQGVEDSIYHDQLHAALERAMEQLTDEEKACIQRRYWGGCTLQEAGGSRLEEKALIKLRRPAVRRELESYVDNRTPYYLRVGVETYQNTRESAVEKIVFIRERIRGQAKDTAKQL